MHHNRVDQLATEIYNYVFGLLDNEPEIDGMAGF